LRLDELAGVLLGGAGERPLLVAEQDRLDEVFRQRAAVDGDEGASAPIRRALDGAGDQLLADARFALEEDGDVRFRRALAEANHAHHVLAFREQVLQMQRAGGPLVHPPDLVLQRVEAQRVLDRDLQALGADRLDDEVDRPGAHR
jgi:hypothetical protein